MALGRRNTDAVRIDMGIKMEPEYSVDKDGTQEWWVDGQLHRLDGPARIWTDGTQEWYVRDQEITSQVEAWMKEHAITWPWDEETQMQFILTWG